ncbi:Uncharacterised protein [Mycobacteroides abscessus subsp. massiliense]|nr:Uncharacterised protein [Mycobacteroides abscessus subsp. massiliense]
MRFELRHLRQARLVDRPILRDGLFRRVRQVQPTRTSTHVQLRGVVPVMGVQLTVSVDEHSVVLLGLQGICGDYRVAPLGRELDRKG